MPTYSNILIFAASILLAGHLPLKSSQAVFSLESEKFQSAHLGMSRPTLLPFTVFPSQQDPSARLEQSKACILAEDGNEVYFEKSGISGSGFDGLRVGHWVEFEVQDGFEELHAVGIERLRRDVERRPEAPQPHG